MHRRHHHDEDYPLRATSPALPIPQQPQSLGSPASIPSPSSSATLDGIIRTPAAQRRAISLGVSISPVRPLYMGSPMPISSVKLATSPEGTTTTATTLHRSPGSLSRRRASASGGGSSSRSLVGSYTLSLISSRMSDAHPSHSIKSAFVLQIGSTSCSPSVSVPSRLRSPPHIRVGFEARWHDLEGGPGGAAVGTPWVGAVDLQGYYFDRYRGESPALSRESTPSRNGDDDVRGRRNVACSSSPTAFFSSRRGAETSPPRQAPAPPALPGYEVGATGVLQLVVKNEVAAIKVFLVQYDLTKLVPGGKLLVRERGYQAVAPGGSSEVELGTSPGGRSPSGSRREVLRYAVELQFTCVAVTRKARRSTGDQDDLEDAAASTNKRRRKDLGGIGSSKAYFLTKQIRVVFPTAGVSGSGGANSRTDTVRDDEDIRNERFVEVMNPLQQEDGGGGDDDESMEASSARSRRLSMGSYNLAWDDICGRWQQEKRAARVASAHRPPALSFERIATPPPMAIKSPSLLTAKLEHSPSLEPSALPSTMDGVASANAKPLRMGDQDSERLLSESLQRLRAGDGFGGKGLRVKET